MVNGGEVADTPYPPYIRGNVCAVQPHIKMSPHTIEELKDLVAFADLRGVTLFSHRGR